MTKGQKGDKLEGNFNDSGMRHSSSPSLPLIGWREWVALPHLNISQIKAKIDTGARSSALHATEIHAWEHNQKPYVRFKIHPDQRCQKHCVEAIAPLLEYRRIRSSNGRQETRPVIMTSLAIADEIWPVEVTLTNRDDMGFRLLLGRQALRQRFLTDPGRSFLLGTPPPLHLIHRELLTHENSDSLPSLHPLFYPSPQGSRGKTRPRSSSD